MKARYFIYVNEDEDIERFVEVTLCSRKVDGTAHECGHYPQFMYQGKRVCLICDAGLEGAPMSLVTILEEG